MLAITRPNGSVYRPRKIRTQFIGDEDETSAIVVLGTHDLVDAMARAIAAVSELNRGIDYQFLLKPGDPGKRVWYRQKLWGFYEDSPMYGFEVDEERGAAGVEFAVITEFELNDLCLNEFDMLAPSEPECWCSEVAQSYGLTDPGCPRHDPARTEPEEKR